MNAGNLNRKIGRKDTDLTAIKYQMLKALLGI